MEILKMQYASIQSSRNVVLTHLEQMGPAALTMPVPAFNNKHLAGMAIHISNVYVHWIGNFALQQGLSYLDESEPATIQNLKDGFARADNVMELFFREFKETLLTELSNTINGRLVNTTPLTVFTHVCTHEFHHKGQMMSMSRLLGHVSPDTDIIRT